MAIVDSRYRFLMVEVGHYGSESDGGVWETSDFNNRLMTGITQQYNKKIINFFTLSSRMCEQLFSHVNI